MSFGSAPAVLALPRTRRFIGQVAPPGSKSIANRALLLAALTRGTTILENLPESDDVRLLLAAIEKLGVSVRRGSGQVVIEGAGGPFAVRKAELFLGNAGTAMRPLTAVLAAGRGEFLLDGDEHMRRRPISDLVDALGRQGVSVSCSPQGTPPVRLHADGLPGGTYKLSGSVSSQFVSALLLAAPLAASSIEIQLPQTPVSLPYIDLTIAMMSDFGVSVDRSSDYCNYRLNPATYSSVGRYAVEADASAATYFLAAGCLPGCGPVRVTGFSRNSRQGDAAFAGVLEHMGAAVSYGPDWIETRAGSELRGIDVDMNAMPDAAMTLAVLALFARGPTYIRNVANLRVKESERLAGLSSELQKLGARIDEAHDSLRIHPPGALTPARIATFDDHRMAMAFALACFGTALEIENPGCTAKTYPHFFADFSSISDGTA